MDMYEGYEVIQSPLLTKVETKTVRRTWKERLWSRPWTPFKRGKFISTTVHSTEVIVDGENRKMYMHPKMWVLLEENSKCFGKKPTLR